MGSPLAQRSVAITGGLGLALALTTSLGALAGLVYQLNPGANLRLFEDTYLFKVLAFTLWQALISTVLSLLLAFPLARALHASPYPRLRRFLFSLSLLAFTLPTLVLVSGLISLFGQQGLLRDGLRTLLPNWSLYGLDGILIAHLYLNLPFAVRVLTLSLDQLPAPASRLARQMRLNTWQRLRWLEWPHLRGALFGSGCLIFILCFNSFGVVLTLGGGPAATTLEVAIYQALKYHFDLNEALLLCWLQLVIVGSCLAWMNRLGKVQWLSRPVHLPPDNRIGGHIAGTLCLLLYGLFLLAPPLSLLTEVNASQLTGSVPLSVLKALLNSAVIVLAGTLIALVLGWQLLLIPRMLRQRTSGLGVGFFEWLSLHLLPLPAMVICVGWYVILISQGWFYQLDLLMLVWINALLVTPFVVTQLKSPLYAFDDQYMRLLQNWRPNLLSRCLLEWKAIQPQLPALACLASLLILGDIAVFAIFGTADWITLPWLIYQYAGSYRLQDAALTSLVLLIASGLLVYRLEGGNRRA